MELLNTFKEYLIQNKVTIEDIIKLGIDILTGLEACHNLGIIHRDIKEDNIFVSNLGKFKLGDFSAARELSPNGFVSNRIGTLHYMPPEVFFGMPYNKSADIYLLGIVLYKMLNHNRIPFLPKFPEIVEAKHFDIAQMNRLNKKLIPAPYYGDNKLHKIILKALSPKIEDRYQIASDMRYELQDLLYLPFKYRNTVLFDYSSKNNNLLTIFTKK
jgi:serine/threonine protein kinase